MTADAETLFRTYVQNFTEALHPFRDNVAIDKAELENVLVELEKAADKLGRLKKLYRPYWQYRGEVLFAMGRYEEFRQTVKVQQQLAPENEQTILQELYSEALQHYDFVNKRITGDIKTFLRDLPKDPRFQEDIFVSKKGKEFPSYFRSSLALETEIYDVATEVVEPYMKENHWGYNKQTGAMSAPASSFGRFLVSDMTEAFPQWKTRRSDAESLLRVIRQRKTVNPIGISAPVYDFEAQVLKELGRTAEAEKAARQADFLWQLEKETYTPVPVQGR